MASSSHLPNISHTVLLQAIAASGAGFGVVTLFVEQAQGTGNPLAGFIPGAPDVPVVRYQDFTSATDTAAALAASEISTEVKDFLDVAWLQDKAPTTVRVCRVDLVGGESYADALVALIAENLSDVWMLCSDLRVVADLEDFATAVEAYGGDYFLLMEDDEADWLTAGVSAAWIAAASNIATYSWSGVAYHDVTTAAPAFGIATNRLAFDPDVTSVGWECDVGGIDAYATYVTPTQRTNAIGNNVSVQGTWGSTDFWWDAVRSFEGRPIKECLTAAWFKARVNEAIQTMHQRESAAGRAVLVDEGGMSQLLSVIEGVISTGFSAKHFTGPYLVTPQAITAADITAQRLRVVVSLQVGTAVRTFTIDSNLSQTAVAVE